MPNQVPALCCCGLDAHPGFSAQASAPPQAERAFASLQELYLEAILGSLIKRGFLSRKLDLLVS